MRYEVNATLLHNTNGTTDRSAFRPGDIVDDDQLNDAGYDDERIEKLLQGPSPGFPPHITLIRGTEDLSRRFAPAREIPPEFTEAEVEDKEKE